MLPPTRLTKLYQEACRRSALAENLKRTRKERGINQAQLARALDLSARQLSMIEKGVAMPGITTIFVMAEILDVSMDYLLGLAPDQARGRTDDWLGDMVRLIKGLSPEDRESVKNILKGLADKGDQERREATEALAAPEARKDPGDR